MLNSCCVVQNGHSNVAAKAKYWLRGLEAKRCSGGFLAALKHYHTYSLPALSYLLQLTDPPNEILSAERYIHQHLTRGPWWTFSPAALMNLSDMGFSHEPHSVLFTSRASMYRVAAHSNIFTQAVNSLSNHPDELEARVYAMPHIGNPAPS